MTPTATGSEPSPPNRGKARRVYDECRANYMAVLRGLNRRIRSDLAKHHINASCKYRLKSFDSYFEKVLRHHQERTGPVLLTDLLGFRIVCPFLSDVEEVERILRDAFPIIERERKGARHSFREFGYDSIHLLIEIDPAALPKTIPYSGRACEVQIRTTLQDAWAEVEHEIIYKAGHSLLNEAIKRKLAALNATLTLSDITFQEIRDFQREIQERGAKRRESIKEKIDGPDSISILDAVPGPASEPSEHRLPFPIKAKGTLERLIFEALEAHGNGRFEEAIEIYTRILSMRPPRPVRAVIHNHRGMAHFVLSRYPSALRDFGRVVALDRTSVRGLNNRALARRMMGQHESALDDLDRSMAIDPFRMETYYIRALTRHALGDFAEALADCEGALRLQPEYAPALRLKKIVAARAVQ